MVGGGGYEGVVRAFFTSACINKPLDLLHPPLVTLTRTGLSRSSIYELINSVQFPQKIRLGLRAVCWLGHRQTKVLLRRGDLRRFYRVEACAPHQSVAQLLRGCVETAGHDEAIELV